MSRKIQLSIPEPCHEDWNAMTPAAGGRFCASCSKEVIDFSGMSDAQLIQFFKEPRGSVCGRFQQQQLSTELVIPKKRIPWLRYFFTISLPALLYSCKPNWIKGEPVAKSEVVETTVGVLITENIEIDTAMVKGESFEVMGDMKAYVTNDTVMMPPNSEIIQGDIEVLPEICTPITKEDSMQVKTLEEVVVQSFAPHITGRYTVGGVSSSIVSTALADTIKTAVKKITDSLKTSIKLYPNPLHNGLPLRVDWNGCKPGVYQMQVVNIAGQVLYTDKVTINAKSELRTIHLPTQKAGAYLITFQNSNAFITYSQKLIIQ